LNLCADQLLMALLPPERLIGITHLSLDAGISYHHEKAKSYQQHSGGIEEIIALKPDLIVAGEFTTQPTNQLLEQLGYEVVRIGLPKTLVDIKQQVLMLGKRVGATQQAETVVKQMELSLAELHQKRIQGTPKAAMYYANGFSAGKNTIVDEALRHAGFNNIAAERGLDFIAPLSMEVLLAAQPEVLILGRYQENTDAMAHQVLQHRALQRYIVLNKIKTIAMPDRYWDCAGPSLVSAIAHLQESYGDQSLTNKGAPQ
jgi:iron complex transport system substrate-binding protein